MCEFLASAAFDKRTNRYIYIWYIYKTRNVEMSQQWHWAKCFPHFVFYICLSVCRVVEGNIYRTFAHCFVRLVHVKKRSFLTSCVFWFVSSNASSNLCFRFCFSKFACHVTIQRSTRTERAPMVVAEITDRATVSKAYTKRSSASS